MKRNIKDIQRIINPAVPLGFGKKEYYPHQPLYLVADVSELSADTGWKAEVGFSSALNNL